MTTSSDKKPTIVDRTLRNPQFMKDAPLCVEALVNFVLAVFNVVVGIIESSLWPFTMAAYFAILCIMGSYVAACSIKPERHSERSVMAVCGICILALAVSITFVQFLNISESHNEPFHPFAMIGMAAFTFLTAVIAIVDATKARKGNGYQQAFLRISIASMLGAMIVLEMHMLGTHAELTDASTTFALEAATGAVMVLLLVLMGISLLLKSRKANAR